MLRGRVLRTIVAALFLLGTVFSFSGCATKGAQNTDANYSAYLAAMQSQIDKEEKPMVDLQLHDNGALKGLKVYAPRQIVPVQQKKADAPHPGWAVANGLLKAATVIGGIWATGDALEGLVQAANVGSTYNIGSHNADSTITDVGAWSRNAGSFNTVSGDADFGGAMDATSYNPDNSDHSDQSTDESTDSSDNSDSSSTTTTTTTN